MLTLNHHPDRIIGAGPLSHRPLRPWRLSVSPLPTRDLRQRPWLVLTGVLRVVCCWLRLPSGLQPQRPSRHCLSCWSVQRRWCRSVHDLPWWCVRQWDWADHAAMLRRLWCGVCLPRGLHPLCTLSSRDVQLGGCGELYTLSSGDLRLRPGLGCADL